MPILLMFILFSIVPCSLGENNLLNSTCPEYYNAFTIGEVTRCHNLTLGSHSYEEADRLCRVSGAELSTVSSPEELSMLRTEAQLLSIEGKVLVNRGLSSNDTCVVFDVNDTGPLLELDCEGEEAKNIAAFSCMLPQRPFTCTVHDGGQSCKMVICPKGQVSYYRKNGNLVCHKVINKPSLWEDAQTMCEQIEDGYKLASFEDDKEAESVMEEARRMFRCKRENCYGTLWIGGRRQPSSNYEWEFDGSLSDIGPYNNFDEGEPDGDRHNKSENCLSVFINEATYLDQHCTDDLEKLKESYYEIRGFVCTTRKGVRNTLEE